MVRFSAPGYQLAGSAVLSILMSLALTNLLRMILVAADGPRKSGEGERPRGPRGPINPTAVFVIMPILINNRFGPERIITRTPGRGPFRRG